MADEKDVKLASALKQAKTTPMCFAFVVKGASDGALMVAKKAIPNKEVTEAKNKTGGKQVIRGTCAGEDGGKLVFQVPEEPPANLAKQIKATIQQTAGLTLTVECRYVAGLKVDEEEGPPVKPAPTSGPSQSAPPPPPPPPPGPAAKNPLADRFAERLKALGPVVLKADSAGVPGAKEAKAKIGEANALFRGKQFEQASAVLDTIEGLLKQGLSAKPAQAPSAQPTPPPKKAAVARVNRIQLETRKIEWKKALSLAQSNLGQLRDLVENDEEYKGLSVADREELIAAVNKLDTSMPEFDTGLYDILDQSYNVEEAQRDPLYQKARQLIAEYTGKLENPLLAAAEEAYPALKIREPISTALANLSKVLAS